MKIDISIVDHFVLYFGVNFEGCFLRMMFSSYFSIELLNIVNCNCTI